MAFVDDEEAEVVDWCKKGGARTNDDVWNFARFID